MKKLSFIFLLITFIFLANSATSQPIVLGEEALNKGDYYEAQEYFNQVIDNAAVVQPFELALAYYYRAWTWIKLYGKGPSDITSVISDPSGEMLLNSYDDLLRSLTHEDGRLTKRINDLLVQLEPGLLQYGLVMVNRAEDYKASGKDYKSTAANAIRYLEPASRINNSYLAFDLQGQAYLLTGDKDKAIEALEKSVAVYEKRPPDSPDFMAGYAFFRLGTLYRDHAGDADRCLDVIHTGKKLMEEEYRKLLNSNPSGDASQLNRQKQEYFRVQNDLHTLELETLLRSPDKLAEAQAVFKSELTRQPDNVNLIIAYASLFEKTDPDVAIEYYTMALEKDPGNDVAEFNLAVVYYNQGQKYFDAGVRAEDEDKQDINVARALVYFKKARPIFEKILETEPGNAEAISAMKLMCFAMDDLEGYEYYKGLEGSR